jgi:hypothetical protein
MWRYFAPLINQIRDTCLDQAYTSHFTLLNQLTFFLLLRTTEVFTVLSSLTNALPMFVMLPLKTVECRRKVCNVAALELCLYCSWSHRPSAVCCNVTIHTDTSHPWQDLQHYPRAGKLTMGRLVLAPAYREHHCFPIVFVCIQPWVLLSVEASSAVAAVVCTFRAVKNGKTKNSSQGKGTTQDLIWRVLAFRPCKNSNVADTYYMTVYLPEDWGLILVRSRIFSSPLLLNMFYYTPNVVVSGCWGFFSQS